MPVPDYINNYSDWIDYVNTKLDEHENWIKSRERDLEMANLRLQRLLDATLQRLGESERVLQSGSESDMKDTVKSTAGPSASSSFVKTSG